MNLYDNYLREVSEKTKIEITKLEKLDRITTILKWINKNEKLNKAIALKGGAAINIALFSFPRIPEKIEFDLMINEKEAKSTKKYIEEKLPEYLNNNGYTTKVNNKNNSIDINLNYKNLEGNEESIKIEIDYNNTHVLKNIEIAMFNKIFVHREMTINCVNPIEIYATLICKLLHNPTKNDMLDIQTLSDFELFGEYEKEQLKKCFMDQYTTTFGYKMKDLNFEKLNNFERIKKYLEEIVLVETSQVVCS